MKKNSVQKNPKNKYLLFSGIFFVLFVLFSAIVKTKILDSFDLHTTLLIQSIVPHSFDPYFSFLSFLGNVEGATVLLVIVLAFRKNIFAYLALGVYGLAHGIELVGKSFLDHPGPPKYMIRSLASQYPQLSVVTSGSYPSGHSLRVLFLAIVTTAVIHGAKKIPRKSKKVLYVGVILYVCLMLFSRVSLGEHWTTDVIAGSLLGTSAGFFSLLFV